MRRLLRGIKGAARAIADGVGFWQALGYLGWHGAIKAAIAGIPAMLAAVAAYLEGLPYYLVIFAFLVGLMLGLGILLLLLLVLLVGANFMSALNDYRAKRRRDMPFASPLGRIGIPLPEVHLRALGDMTSPNLLTSVALSEERDLKVGQNNVEDTQSVAQALFERDRKEEAVTFLVDHVNPVFMQLKNVLNTWRRHVRVDDRQNSIRINDAINFTQLQHRVDGMNIDTILCDLSGINEHDYSALGDLLDYFADRLIFYSEARILLIEMVKLRNILCAESHYRKVIYQHHNHCGSFWSHGPTFRDPFMNWLQADRQLDIQLDNFLTRRVFRTPKLQDAVFRFKNRQEVDFKLTEEERT